MPMNAKQRNQLLDLQELGDIADRHLQREHARIVEPPHDLTPPRFVVCLAVGAGIAFGIGYAFLRGPFWWLR